MKERAVQGYRNIIRDNSWLVQGQLLERRLQLEGKTDEINHMVRQIYGISHDMAIYAYSSSSPVVALQEKIGLVKAIELAGFIHVYRKRRSLNFLEGLAEAVLKEINFQVVGIQGIRSQLLFNTGLETYFRLLDLDISLHKEQPRILKREEILRAALINKLGKKLTDSTPGERLRVAKICLPR